VKILVAETKFKEIITIGKKTTKNGFLAGWSLTVRPIILCKKKLPIFFRQKKEMKKLPKILIHN